MIMILMMGNHTQLPAPTRDELISASLMMAGGSIFGSACMKFSKVVGEKGVSDVVNAKLAV